VRSAPLDSVSMRRRISSSVVASSYIASVLAELEIEILGSTAEDFSVCVDRTIAVRVVWELERHI
jgi:hypothetical protein